MIQFPNVTASNLHGHSFALPGDFEAAHNVVVIAFTQYQQYDVNTWLPFLSDLKHVYPIHAYELPTIRRGNPAFRFMIDYYMTNGITDPEVRATTITLYVDVAAFMRALGLPTNGRIYTLLVDRAGEVVWRADGMFRPEKGRALADRLATLYPGHGPMTV
jgi:hypothetical protein